MHHNSNNGEIDDKILTLTVDDLTDNLVKSQQVTLSVIYRNFDIHVLMNILHYEFIMYACLAFVCMTTLLGFDTWKHMLTGLLTTYLQPVCKSHLCISWELCRMFCIAS